VSPRELLEHLFRSAVAACDPRPATRDAVAALAFDGAPAVIAVGKGAQAMALGALDALAARGLTPRVGLVVSHTGAPDTVGPLPHVAGSHPVPDGRSFEAARTLGRVVDRARGCSDVLVLLSGGTTSLVAHPVDAITTVDLRRVFDALLRSGAPINTMNVIRRRLLQWGGGRLAAALSPARVRCLIVSDVMGSELAAIGSGPCVADPASAADVRVALTRWTVDVPDSVSDYLRQVEEGSEGETPKPGDPRLARVETRVLLDNAAALGAVRAAAERLGLERIEGHGTLQGEASGAGRAIGFALGQLASSLGDRCGVLALGGETTVTLPEGPGRPGGRCQELALACAEELDRATGSAPLTLLAAGTDGRDGPTDAAGAIVDRTTWRRVRAAGRDPSRDLLVHDVHASLDSAGALLRTGPTGTNVNDLVIGIVGTRA
jgi:hydroxypyruvate reductase